MLVRLRSGDDVIELQADGYAVFDEDAGLVIISDHTLLRKEEFPDLEVLWIV